MAAKNKSNGNSGPYTTAVERHADQSPESPTPSHEEIGRRAYEIYLERGDLPGDELDDWLRAERELQKVALFTRDWNRVQRRVAATQKTEIEIRPMERNTARSQR